MKKVVSLLVALALFATTAFAAPVSVAASLPEPVQTVASSADLDALFADVNAVALTEEEAQAVEGEGIFGAIIFGGFGACVGGFLGLTVGVVTGDIKTGTKAGMASGGVIGAIGGLIGFPF